MSVPNLITCEVDDIQYLLHPQVLGSTEAPIKADQVIPVLLLTEEELNGTPDQIGQLLQYYVDTDDVCSPSFTDILVEKPSKNGNISLFTERKDDSSCSSKATYRLQKTSLHTSSTDNPEAQDDDNLPSGPYFLSGPNLHQAYRLYPDTQDAFIYGMIPNDVHNPSGFQAVSFLASDSMSKTIPVPSRHYTRLTTRGEKRPSPIRGKRITLTDGLSLLGTQTTLSCKAYVDTYPPATETDAYVQRLLEEGAESSRNNVKKILYLDYAKDQKSEYAMDVFVNALERHLNVDRTTVNLDEEWEKYQVKSGIYFSLSKTAQFLYDLNHYHEYAKFRKDYQTKIHSSRGLVDLEAQVLWSSARDHGSLDGCLCLRITQNPGEWLGDEQTYSPVVASVIGPRMTDTSLIALITQALKASGLPTSVQPGPLCFPLPSSADATTAIAVDSDGNEAGPTAAELQGRAATKLHLHEMWLYSERVEEDDHEKIATLTSEQGKKLKCDGNSWDGKTLAKSSLDIKVDLRGLKE
ncbi:hypothetical protein NEUTE2DRAFT_110688 [Neurospora tetrasperma FGSC 2509]|nr:hypothetical protein NEUTE2DRAFT_110688 [Neurospora tetrasperma FGSC 2509]